MVEVREGGFFELLTTTKRDYVVLVYQPTVVRNIKWYIIFFHEYHVRVYWMFVFNKQGLPLFAPETQRECIVIRLLFREDNFVSNFNT